MATKKNRFSKYLDRHESDVLKINKRKVNIPKEFHPTGVVKEQFDDDGKKLLSLSANTTKLT